MVTAWMPTRAAEAVPVEDPSTVVELLAVAASTGLDDPMRDDIQPIYRLAVCECGASARGVRWNMHPVSGLRSVVFEGGRPPCEHWVVDDVTSHL